MIKIMGRFGRWLLAKRKIILIWAGVLISAAVLTGAGSYFYLQHQKALYQQEQEALKIRYRDSRNKILSELLENLEVVNTQLSTEQVLFSDRVFALGRIINHSAVSYIKDPGEYGSKNRVSAEGSFSFRVAEGLRLNVIVYDCPEKTYTPDCLIIYEKAHAIATSLPANQARDFKVELREIERIRPEGNALYEFKPVIEPDWNDEYFDLQRFELWEERSAAGKGF